MLKTFQNVQSVLVLQCNFKFNKLILIINFSKPQNARCGHILCEACWKNCLKIKLECPLCKTKVREKHLVTIYLQNILKINRTMGIYEDNIINQFIYI